MTKPTDSTFHLLSKRNHIVVLLTTVIATTGCAFTGTKASDYSSQNIANSGQLAPTSSGSSADASQVIDVESAFIQGTAAYRQGNLDTAEQQFRDVLTRQPRHSKATYNISMIYLRRAYDGLNRYTSLEIDQARRKHAQSLLLKLDEIGDAN